jgi:hypothetical protein
VQYRPNAAFQLIKRWAAQLGLERREDDRAAPDVAYAIEFNGQCAHVVERRAFVYPRLKHALEDPSIPHFRCRRLASILIDVKNKVDALLIRESTLEHGPAEQGVELGRRDAQALQGAIIDQFRASGPGSALA